MPNTGERIQALEDALTVMAHLEQSQSCLLKEHSEIMADFDARLQQQLTAGKLTDERIEKLVSAIGKLISKQ